MLAYLLAAWWLFLLGSSVSHLNVVIVTCIMNHVWCVRLQSPVVTWKMKAPEKKPLVARENPDEIRAKVRKGAKKKGIEPIKALSEFQTESFA